METRIREIEEEEDIEEVVEVVEILVSRVQQIVILNITRQGKLELKYGSGSI